MAKGDSNPVLAFDVYGTLLDPLRMEEHLRASFGDRAKEASELWRAKQLEYSFRRALMKKYRDFDDCTAGALRFVSLQLATPLTEEGQKNLLGKYRELPPYPDVVAAVGELAAQRYTIVACSNGTESAVRASLDHARLLVHFSKIVSADPLRTFKPDPAVYESLAASVRAPREKIWLISSNAFDVIGAKACGLRSIWVQRDPMRAFDPWEFEPDAVIHSLGELRAVVADR
jgi:2-haloacid dehalogenase